MTQYRNSNNGAVRTSATFMGYPWVSVEPAADEPREEFSVRTIEAIMLSVGDSAEAAQTELEAEAARETPRTTLLARLRAVIAAAEVYVS